MRTDFEHKMVIRTFFIATFFTNPLLQLCGAGLALSDEI